jgi:hypothetical protein
MDRPIDEAPRMFGHHFSATCICFGYHSSQAARRKKMEGNNSQVAGIILRHPNGQNQNDPGQSVLSSLVCA